MIQLALVVAAGSLASGLVLAFLLRRAPTVWAQLTGLALIAVCVPLAAVLLSGWVMFHMGADVKILAVAAGSATAAVFAALVLARSITTSLRRVGAASRSLASGDLSARAPAGDAREIAELAASFNAMAAALEQLFDARRELVAWASHDLRTPLASMRAMLEALEDGLAEPAEYLPALRDRIDTLTTLVDDLFELARIDAGVLTVEVRETAIDRIVESCVRGFEAEARTKRIQLEARLEAPLPNVRCAPDKVERVLHNLLTNALRHTPSDGAIAIVVQPQAASVTVAVEDTGEGLDPEAGRRMFERFWRGESSRTTPGSGLGLAIARGLVEAQGGRIWAEPRAEGGAKVAFTLPAA